MRIKPQKCKVIFTLGKDNSNPPTKQLGGNKTENLTLYKYLSIEINKILIGTFNGKEYKSLRFLLKYFNDCLLKSCRKSFRLK